MKIAVLTGDLVNSTKVTNPAAFVDRLRTLLREVEQRYASQAVTFRGDGFQVTVPKPEQALVCALYIRAGLIATSPEREERWDARVSVAIGAESGEGGVYGDAFIESGRGLDTLQREQLYLYASPALFRLATGIATAFADDIIGQWTPSEAQAYYTYLQHPESHQAVADALGKSRPTVTKSLLRARYNLIDRYLATVNQLLEQTYAA